VQHPDVFDRAGLEVLGTAAGPLPPIAAWKKVISGAAVPTVVVPDERPDQVAVVESEWRRLATEHAVLDPDDTFLLSLPGPGALAAPWMVVRLTPAGLRTEHLPERPGEPEFVTAARDRPVVLGVTTEEYGIWLIVDEP
jgi:hypothetical protein